MTIEDSNRDTVAGGEDRKTEDAEDRSEASGGEDESSTEKDGDDSHLHEDQKAPRLSQ